METVLPTTAEIACTAGALRYLARLSGAKVDAVIVAIQRGAAGRGQLPHSNLLARHELPMMRKPRVRRAGAPTELALQLFVNPRAPGVGQFGDEQLC